MSDSKTSVVGGIVVDTDLMHELAELLDARNLTEIEVKDGDRTIRVARTAAAVTMAAGPASYAPAPPAGGWPAPPPAAAATASAPSGGGDVRNHPGLVKSPIVGTAYLTPEPGAPAFITEGATVAAGATLLIIEAMKVMNPITAPKGGVVKAILVNNEQPVEYDQPLVIIE
ncbi:acetyl-CoA carboxylase biotin carboxyl carrier protein [Sandarakinorhabdus limnophila]|jgi:acetyl-CoA carboxylase biotin carboxyl carrier protein|uniref:acetyl-CoA carboxylase biotin carboxyl carrier protein n=1 Tax=Sandarakinorhabdus limnophila TaxID=210512 RepID=UPI0026EC9DF6|nr:acetyl-CoA carboxylase biotin carboxyl carrier protein [Sandarakinorhabdus limnophila]